MEQKFKIIVSQDAKNDLSEIFSYISQKLSSPIAADHLFAKLSHQIEQLSLFPMMYPVMKNESLAQRGYRFLAVDNFVVIYLPQDDKVSILRVVYGKRDLSLLFGE